MINRSTVLQLLYFVKNGFTDWLARDAKEGGGGTLEETPADAKVNPAASFKPPTTADWREVWELTEAGVVRLAHEVRQAGARFSMAVIVHPKQVHGAEGEGAEDYAQRRLQRLADREGFPLIDLLAPFRAAYRERSEYLYGFKKSRKGRGHWNQRGHRIAADVVSARLCDLLSAKAGK